jgi:TatD DNase family protein
VSLIDTHCHLDFPDYRDDLNSVIRAAMEAGVTRMISIGTTIESSQGIMDMAEAHSAIRVAVGIHPSYVQETMEPNYDVLERLACHPKTAAIGECGLDYHYLLQRADGETEKSWQDRIATLKEKQKSVFRAQLELAARLGLGVVVHQRDSWEDTLEILSEFRGRVRAVLHCFGESIDRACQALDMGCLLSFTGIVTFKNARVAHETASKIPSGSYMVETDCPYLAPVPHRGKRCEPAHVVLVARCLAELRGKTFEEIALETTQTAEGFFRLGS